MSIQKGTITRCMESTFGDLEKEFSSFYNIRDFQSKLAALKLAIGKSNYSSKLRDLFDMLDACGIEYEKRKDYGYYEELIENSVIPDFEDIQQKMFFSLYEKYQKYPSPEDYIKRIVDRLEKDNWKKDTLRVRILKQFIKYGNCLTYKKINGIGKEETVNIYGGAKYIKDYLAAKERKATKNNIDQYIDDIKDDIFDVLLNATKQDRGPEGKYGIIKLADDLASGNFRTGGSTKKALYLFAMVYDMSFCTKSSDIIDQKTDIEINLFQNYYTNNLIKFVKQAYRDNLSEYDLDPSGQGINYKNYAEIIYLYYISKDMCAKDKIKLSNEMILELKKSTNSDEKDFKKIEQENRTEYFKAFFKKSDKFIYCEDIIEQSEDDFKDFIRREYNCSAVMGNNPISVMQIETEQETAYRIYEDLINKLDEILKEDGMQRIHCHYGLWFTDVSAFLKEGLKNATAKDKEFNQQQFDDFVEVLLGANRFVGRTVYEKEDDKETDMVPARPTVYKTKALFVKSKNEITRTSLIVAYYYYYNARHELDRSYKWKNFKELFLDFQRGVNEKLEAAFYQPFSIRNLFDVLIAFSAYAYHNV